MSTPSSSLEQAHRRYLEQAGWTAAARKRLFDIVDLAPGTSVLEVGSGTGAICSSIAHEQPLFTYGLDLDPDACRLARQLDPKSRYLVGDGYRLPFPASAFDAAVCHFLLLWLENPLAVLREMLRVLRPGGCLLALAEPDYGGRVEHPPELGELGRRQIDSLGAAGANPFIGRRLRELLLEAGAGNIFSGVIGAEWRPSDLEQAASAEREIMEQDLAGRQPEGELRKLLEADQTAASEGRRTLFVPTFFALGYAKS